MSDNFSEYTDLGDCIRRNVDGVFIPLDPDNKEYCEYLVWLERQQRGIPGTQ